MGYCDLDFIKELMADDELIRLTDKAGTGAIDTSRVDSAIESADVEIDAYLGEKMSLPLGDPPAILETLSRTLSIRNLYLLSAGGIPESWEKQAQNATRMLEQIASGKLTLGAGDPEAGATDNTVQLSSATRIFSREKMRGF